MIESSSGLILRTRSLTDTSLIVNWLTPNSGRVATVAKGARRPKSPFAGKLDIFYEADFSFQRSRKSELHQLREVSLLGTHSSIRNDLGKLQQAAYCAALVEQATETDTPMPEIFSLVTSLLNHLDSRETLAQTVPAFELRFLTALGLQPDGAKLRPDAREFVRLLASADWTALARLKMTNFQFEFVTTFLENHLLYHLGRLPKGRRLALLEA